MISLFTSSEYEPHHITYLADMQCSWSHAGTKLTLVEIHWHSGIRKSFHLLVQEQGGSNSKPVSLGLNQGSQEIDDALKAQLPPPELLALILRSNPEIKTWCSRTAQIRSGSPSKPC